MKGEKMFYLTKKNPLRIKSKPKKNLTPAQVGLIARWRTAGNASKALSKAIRGQKGIRVDHGKYIKTIRKGKKKVYLWRGN